MRFRDLINTLADEFDLEPVEGREVLRTLREGSTALDDKRVASSLTATPGRGNGLEATNFNVSVWLVAMGLHAQRKGLFDNAWSTWSLPILGSVRSAWENEQIPPDERCPITGARMLGEAIQILLRSPNLAQDVTRIRVSTSGGWAILETQNQETVFARRKNSQATGLSLISEFSGRFIHRIAQLIN